MKSTSSDVKKKSRGVHEASVTVNPTPLHSQTPTPAGVQAPK